MRSKTLQLSAPRQTVEAQKPLERFILNFADSRGGSGPAQIRAVTHDQALQAMTFHMARNRYCANIGREHRSNNIMFTVSFLRRTVYQHCYDSQCRSFRSKEAPVPEWALKNATEQEMP